VAVTPDGSQVYVANAGLGTVSVIATATNMVTATIPVGTGPQGVGIQPAAAFSCYATTVSLLTRQFGSINTAAKALGFRSVTALENAIRALCQFVRRFRTPDCYEDTVVILTREFGTLYAAARALGFPSATALQYAILGFCRG
jgi:YVTN family beta-propeller protein